MTLKGFKPGDKAVIINNFTTNEQQRLKEHYETFNKNLELGYVEKKKMASILL